MTFKLGLTGSIGMGKSTTAQMFVDEGCALWDADAAVHRLYAKGGAAVRPISAVFPESVVDGAVSRAKLKTIISRNSSALSKIEEIVHPLVAEDRRLFLESSENEITVLDIPLLFETGADASVDMVVCVSIPLELQEKRVMERGTMTADHFAQIKAKQMSNADKEKRSDYVIVTDTVEHARAQVQSVLKDIKAKIADA